MSSKEFQSRLTYPALVRIFCDTRFEIVKSAEYTKTLRCYRSNLVCTSQHFSANEKQSRMRTTT